MLKVQVEGGAPAKPQSYFKPEAAEAESSVTPGSQETEQAGLEKTPAPGADSITPKNLWVD